MESSRVAGPVIIRFKNRQEAVDFAVKVSLKHFIMRLLYVRHSQESIILADEHTKKDTIIARDIKARVDLSISILPLRLRY